MNFRMYPLLGAILVLFLASACGEKKADSETGQPSVQYILGTQQTVEAIYPDDSWVPAPYQKYFTDYPSTVQYWTEQSLQNDHITYQSVQVSLNGANYEVTIQSSDSKAQGYANVHPKWIENYHHALKGIEACQSQAGCWNKNDTIADQPWVFFPQFGLPMVNQKSVLLLNYPPTTALTDSSYLNTFTMNRWSRVLKGAGVSEPTLFEPIVDVRPIAAPGSNTSQNLPDALTYFNDSSESFGGYYIVPQLLLMLDPPSNPSSTHTLPLVVLGTPAREAWCKLTGVTDSILNTGVVQLAGNSKFTPFILGNHPDVTTYQCCPGDPYKKCDSYDLVPDEQIDLQINSWADIMSQNPSQDPHSVLAACHKRWVTNISKKDKKILCVLAKLDNNNWSKKCVSPEQASDYCDCYDNDPCATYDCTPCDSYK